MPEFHTLTVSDVRKETTDCTSIAFDVPAHLAEKFAFTHGQYLTLKVQLKGEDVRRSYSLCVSPLDNELRVAVKQVEGGKFSTYANTKTRLQKAHQKTPSTYTSQPPPYL